MSDQFTDEELRTLYPSMYKDSPAPSPATTNGDSGDEGGAGLKELCPTMKPTEAKESVDPEEQEMLDGMFPSMADGEADDEGFAVTVAEWGEQARADPELKDDFDAHIERAQQLLTDHGSDELAQILASTGLGSHPAVVRFAAKIARELKKG